MLGNRTESVRHLASALQQKPNDAEVLYFAAVDHALLGDRREAISWLKRSLGRGYSRSEIANTMELDSLKNDPEFRDAVMPQNAPARSTVQ
jgi:hypothetical protein